MCSSRASIAAGAWAGSAVLLVLLYSTSAITMMGGIPYQAIFIGAMVALLIATDRFMRGREIVRRLKRLEGSPLSFIKPDELRKLKDQNKDSIWLGYGFNWTNDTTQQLYNVVRADPSRLHPQDNDVKGQRWLQGLGDEEIVTIPWDHFADHTLILGTTGAGKTRLYDLLITQKLLMGQAVIVIDPKGDADLKESILSTLKMLGRPESDLVYLHPAYPMQSARIDPMRNFNRASELATRIANLIPSETGNDPFTAFGQKVLNNIIGGVLIVNDKPNLLQMRRIMDGGLENLVVKASRAHFDRVMPNWHDSIKIYLEAAKASVRGAKELTPEIWAIAMIGFYRERILEAGHKPMMNTALEALFSAFEHDKAHASKMLASLAPIMDMLTSADMGPLLSPDYEDVNDKRVATDLSRAIQEKKVVLIGLDTLSDGIIGRCLGSLFLSEISGISGDRYNYGSFDKNDPDRLQPVNLFVDEASECMNDPLIACLNKGRGSLLRVYIASQSWNDVAARLGSRDKAEQVFGNLNNIILLRVINEDTQKFIANTFPEVIVKSLKRSRTDASETEDPLDYKATLSVSQEETEMPMFPPALFGSIPNLEYVAKVSAGRIIKGRLPILLKDAA